MLLAFSRDYLHGEGDITRHLSHLGYVVTHVQTVLDEYNYAVSNLASDLRDGLKLTSVPAAVFKLIWGKCRICQCFYLCRSLPVISVLCGIRQYNGSTEKRCSVVSVSVCVCVCWT